MPMQAERTPQADDSLLAAPLLAVTEWEIRAPATVLVAACALALLAVAVTVNGLTFKTSRLDLLNPRSEYNQRWLAYLAEFGDRDDACVVVRADRTADLTVAIDEIAAQLRQEPKLFDSVFFQRDLSRLKGKALHYLPAEQLIQLEQQVAALSAVLPRSGEGADPAARLARLNEELTHVAAANPQARARIDAQYAQLAESVLATLGGPAAVTRQTVGRAQAQVADLNRFDSQYLLADEGRIGFVLTRLNAQNSESSPGSAAIARLREIARSIRQKQPHVWVGVTGMPVIEFDEMAASQFDMVWTSVASMILVLLLYLAAYGGLRHAMLVNFLLLLGTAYSFGFVTIAVGHLNILSAAFSAVLIGLGIDFAIHYVATYLNLRRHGCDEETALLRMAVEVGPGVVTGGVTTAAAFFMAALTDFIGVRELGLVAGGGILLCVLSTVVVLPPLILLVDRRWPLVRLPHILPAGRWFQFPLRFPRLTMGLSLVVAAIVTAGSSSLRYDHNLLNLQPRHLESADIERQLFTRLDDSIWFGVSVCSSRDELRTRKAAFERLHMVAKTEEIASLIPDRPEAETARIESLCRQLVSSPNQPEAARLDVARLNQEAAKAHALLSRETPYETPATARLDQLRAALTSLPPDQVAARIVQGQAALISRATAEIAPLRAIADPVGPNLSDLPKELTDRFVGKNQTYLLKVFAHGNIWNMGQLEKFVHALESVDARITGHPVQTYYASRHMQSSYLWAGLYSLGAVLVLLWIDFRSLKHSLLAMVPLAIGFATMCGCLGWLDIPFNPANMIVLPLILGIGVDHGVHLVHLWRQQRGRFVLGDATTVAVLLTASTTTASFGALILARHQGLQSLGQVLTLGVTTCLAASIIFFPALLCWLTRNRPAEEVETVQSSVVREAVAAVEEVEQPIESAPAVAPPEMPAAVAEPELILPPAELPGPEPAAVELPPLPPIAPAPVTDEEIAALLESALSVLPSGTPACEVAISDEPGEELPTSTPRRRELPRRSQAA
jgi:hopanoid biosynthesis associated RND transporter like protein HpnN